MVSKWNQEDEEMANIMLDSLHNVCFTLYMDMMLDNKNYNKVVFDFKDVRFTLSCEMRDD